MRPTRLELQGFTAFAEPVVVDFGDAELFAFAGPTGAGKSSLIDALCFALYGSVPRLDRRTVAPVVTTGRLEARVRLDFTVGPESYTAVRVVRRLARGGATTKEARLESGAEVIAGDADDVTRKVEALLGLGFEQFTKCVVLPQGDFARFLHDRPSDRQQLLVRLLELGVFERVREAASARRAGAEARRDASDSRLSELVDATPAALAEADQRVARLQALRDELDANQPRLDALQQVRQQAAESERALRSRSVELAQLTAPADLEHLSERSDAAQRRRIEAETAVDDAAQDLAAAERVLDALPARRDLEQALDAHRRRSELKARAARGKRIVDDRSRQELAAAEALVAAETQLATAEAALERVRHEHAAASLAATLQAGAPCPVCQQTVAALPDRSAPAQVATAEAVVAAARSARTRTEQTLRAAAETRGKAEQALLSLTEQLADLDRQLHGQPPAAELAALRDQVAVGEAALARAREEDRAARARLRRATAEVADIATRQADAWRQFSAVRDRVADLAPPAAGSDLPAAWRALVAWAGVAGGKQAAAAEAAAVAVRQAGERYEALSERLAARCRACGIVLDQRRPRDACADALAHERAVRSGLADAIATAERLRSDRDAAASEAAVARALAGHLSARGFEQWLLDEAMHRLAGGASEVLRQLSAGQYSLAVDTQRNFLAVDHRNGDQPRPARTLSGGETFLASLALALTLADHLVALATEGAPRLESIFLDEGFGTLDPETLDTVAAAIEELGAGGRTVGLVTHVRELAERLPVRFEVRRQPGGSTVEKVIA